MRGKGGNIGYRTKSNYKEYVSYSQKDYRLHKGIKNDKETALSHS